VQNLVELKHGRLKITEAKFYRISGDSTQHRGVIPDVQLPSLLDPEEIGESSYDNALPWDRIHPAPHQNYFNISKYLPTIETNHQERMAQDPDFIFLNKQSAMFKEAAAKKEVSLRLATRQAEQQQMEKRALEIENQKRIAKGEKPYADYAALKKANGGDDDEDAPPKETDKEIKPKEDPYLMEAGHVLADFIDQIKAPEQKVAKQ
jgi:carboxyl-terminal processing protease